MRLFIDGHIKREQAKHRENIWLAFHVAAFSRAKRLSSTDYYRMMKDAGAVFENKAASPKEWLAYFKAMFPPKKDK